MASEEEDEGDVLSGLFTDEDYVERTFTVGTSAVEQTVLCSDAASTDYDLTGQIVWPVSIFLAHFIASNPHLYQHKTLVELGAGCGLPGTVR